MNTAKSLPHILLPLLIACSGTDETKSLQKSFGIDSKRISQVAGESVSVQFLQTILLNTHDLLSEDNRQIILVSNSTPEALSVIIRTFEKDGGMWRTKFPDMIGSGAKNGFAPYGQKQEGDSRAPTGVFKLSETFGYHRSAETLMPYTQATERDFWIDDITSGSYNTWMRMTDDRQPDVSHERMKRDDHLYEYGIIVDYNIDPIVKGKGSAIFIHVERARGAPTVGCIATSRVNLLTLLKWLDPDKAPVIIMGTENELATAELHGDASE